jgi:prepilin-type N-terminal cleavage/methylation domain-containing protein
MKQGLINKNKKQDGFTLMEITVSTAIFAIIMVSLLSLFNYVLKINRRTEALRQASQGMRSFVEYLVKEIRNGQVDYYVSNGNVLDSRISASSPCGAPGSLGADTYGLQENKLGIINTDSIKECFYFAKADGSYVDTVGANASTFSAPAGSAYTMAMQKAGVTGAQIINPPNLRLDKLKFLVRPTCNPYSSNCSSYSNSYPKIQPFVTILVKFTAALPTGEQVPIYYQTSVSSNQYDIPNQ